MFNLKNIFEQLRKPLGGPLKRKAVQQAFGAKEGDKHLKIEAAGLVDAAEALADGDIAGFYSRLPADTRSKLTAFAGK